MALPAPAHDVITTKLTWAKEVSRVVNQRCAGCHRPQGRAFSLLTYNEARPWAKAMQEEVLLRRMPPWDAVKGFGEFAHELGLSQEEIHTISDWVEGGAPEGDANLAPEASKLRAPESVRLRGVAKALTDGAKLIRSESWVGIRIRSAPPKSGWKLAAELPSGEWVPLLWVESRTERAGTEYEFARALKFPAGTVVHLVTEAKDVRLEAILAAGAATSPRPKR